MKVSRAFRVQPPRGTTDVFESDLQKIEHFQGLGFGIARNYGFSRVDIPMFEHLDIFELTAPFNREKCYIFPDKSGRELALRPDIMAPISRLVVNNCMNGVFPLKMFFADKVFRYRHGKRREFRLFGLETYGSNGYYADAEVIQVAMDIFWKIGLNQLIIKFSYPSVYDILIKEAIEMHALPLESSEILHQLQLCKSQNDIHSLLVSNAFPREMQDLFLRMLLCKDEACSWQIIKELAGRTNNFAQVADDLLAFSEALSACNLKDSSVFEIGNIHGLGYYSGLTYRIDIANDGQQLADGGRYDTFVQKLCGKSINATGIAFGIERLISIVENQGISIVKSTSNIPRVLVILPSRSLAKRLLPILYALRQQGYVIDEYCQSVNFSHAVKYAQARKHDFILSFNQLQDVEDKIVARAVSLKKEQTKDYIIDDIEEDVRFIFSDLL